MCGRLVSAEAHQYQVVVRVVSHVPNHNVLEQTTLFAQDAVSLGVHHPAAPVHGLCTAILQLRHVPWEEMAGHVLQDLLLQTFYNTLVPVGRVSDKNKIAQKITYAETVSNYVAPCVAPQIAIYPHVYL